jgi:hypothetical protein
VRRTQHFRRTEVDRIRHVEKAQREHFATADERRG